MQRLLICSLLISCCGVVAEHQTAAQTISKEQRHKHVAFIRPYAVLQQSQEFNDRKQQIQNEMNGEAKNIHNDAQRISDEKQELQKEVQELQNSGKSKFTSAQVRQSKMDEVSEREAQLQREENNLKDRYQRLRDKHNRKEQELQMEMWDKMTKAAEMVGQEQGWGAIDVASMYVSPALDVTEDVAEAMNKMYKDQQGSKQHAQKQTEEQAAEHTKQNVQTQNTPAAASA